jgi:hypothetical protein
LLVKAIRRTGEAIGESWGRGEQLPGEVAERCGEERVAKGAGTPRRVGNGNLDDATINVVSAFGLLVSSTFSDVENGFQK